MATALPISGHNGNGAPFARHQRSWTLDDTLRVIAELGSALQDQCARAQRASGDEDEHSATRVQIDALAAQAREIHLRSQAIARGLAARARPTPPAPARAPIPSSNGTAETRACAVHFTVALKLDGVSRQRAEALLIDEFGRDDAAEIAREAFDPHGRAA